MQDMRSQKEDMDDSNETNSSSQLLFYQKPRLGVRERDAEVQMRAPVQFLTASGKMEIGMPHEVPQRETPEAPASNRLSGPLILVSWNSPDANELRLRRSLSFKFILLIACNLCLVTTICMGILQDSSQVERGVDQAKWPDSLNVNAGQNTGLPRPFQRHTLSSDTDGHLEELIMVWFTSLLGISSACHESSSALTAFILIVLARFMMGISPPAVIFAVRYPLDGALVYIAFQLRKKLLCAWVSSSHRFPAIR